VSQNILIEHREKKFTSRKAAVSFVARGRAVWTSDTSIRFLESSEQFAVRTARQEEHHWREVAAQRGGVPGELLVYGPIPGVSGSC